VRSIHEEEWVSEADSVGISYLFPNSGLGEEFERVTLIEAQECLSDWLLPTEWWQLPSFPNSGCSVCSRIQVLLPPQAGCLVSAWPK
jgi:hypothetical protein